MTTMQSLKSILVLLLGIYLFLGEVTSGWAGENAAQSLYSELLQRYVKNGVVDYQGFKNEEATLDEYLKILENTRVDVLSRDEQFAFYVNAYNSWTIKLVLSGYPKIKSIKDLGNIFKTPWQKKIVRINGEVITLDDVEHKILRKKFRDPRVHFAVNCASKSCPPLISEPYRGSSLSQQLDDSTRAFINDPGSNYLKGNKLYVSKIFKWFPEDFDDNIVDFFLKYAEEDFKKELEARKDKIKIKYLHYDWSLNGAVG